MAESSVRSIEGYRLAAGRQRRRSVALTLAFSLFVGWVLLAFPPGLLAVLMCAVIAFAVVTWRRPVVGLASLLFASLLFEQYDFAWFTPITRMVPFFDNASQHIAGIKGFEASPLEVLLVVAAAVVLAQIVLRIRPARANPLAMPVLAFMGAVVLWLVYGRASGGQVTLGLWEVRALGYFALLVFVVPHVISTEKDVRLMVWTAIAAIGIKALQGVWNYVVVLHGDLSLVRSVTGHEDALFIAAMALLLIGLTTYRTAPRQRAALLALTPVMIVTFVATDRRAAYVALAVGLTIVAALIATDPSKRRLLLTAWLPVTLVMLAVTAVGWNDRGPVGVPARLAESIISPQDKQDVDSSYYRQAEEINLLSAIQREPVLGLGFGRPFQHQGALVDVGFSLENVIPHDEVMGIWAKMGTAGFGLFWVMVGGVIVFGCVTFRAAKRPYTKVLAALATATVAMQVVVSSVDLQLTYARNMVFLGVLVGILSRLPALDADEVQA